MKMTLLCIINTILMATGQTLFKLGARGKSIEGILDIVHLFFTPVVFCALCLYAGTTALWLYILNHMSLSSAYPIQALAFPLVLIASMLIFKESVSITKWVGIVVIVLGVIIAARG